eukprot:7190063-Alexandrium_andersonii.AAC.1
MWARLPSNGGFIDACTFEHLLFEADAVIMGARHERAAGGPGGQRDATSMQTMAFSAPAPVVGDGGRPGGCGPNS